MISTRPARARATRLLSASTLLTLFVQAASCAPAAGPEPATAASTPEPLGKASSAPSDDAVRRILVERLGEHAAAYGIVVGLLDARGPRVIAHGSRDKGHPRPLDGDTLFEIGSVTKVFTSVLLADAVRRGDVRLEDAAARYLPPPLALPRSGEREITMADLATHHSGLPRMPDNFSPANPQNPYADYSTERLYEYLTHAQLSHPVGEQYDYSNLAAGLLGHLLERQAQTPWDELVRTRITEPLGMSSTAVALTPELQSRLAPGHTAFLEPAANWELAALVGAGGLRSTANDLLSFARAALGGAKGSALGDSLARSQVLQRRRSEAGGGMALGWHVEKKGDREVLWHNGGTGGYRSFIGIEPARQTAVVVLCNLNTPGGVDDLGMHLLLGDAPLLGAGSPEISPARLGTEIPLARAELERFVGQYKLSPGAMFSITLAEKGLLAQLTGQPALPIYPESPTRFFYREVAAQLVFELDGEGAPVAVVLHQNGRELRCPRFEGELAPLREIELSPAIFDRYVGRYQLASGAVLDVRREGKRFVTQLTGQQPVDIFASSEREFFLKVVDAQLTFEVDARGRASACILHQGGRHARAERIE